MNKQERFGVIRASFLRLAEKRRQNYGFTEFTKMCVLGTIMIENSVKRRIKS